MADGSEYSISVRTTVYPIPDICYIRNRWWYGSTVGRIEWFHHVPSCDTVYILIVSLMPISRWPLSEYMQEVVDSSTVVRIISLHMITSTNTTILYLCTYNSLGITVLAPFHNQPHLIEENGLFSIGLSMERAISMLVVHESIHMQSHV